MLPLFLLVKVTFSISEATTLADLLALRLHQMEDAVRSIVDKAVKELGTEKVGSSVSFQTGLILRIGTSDDSGRKSMSWLCGDRSPSLSLAAS